MRLVATCGVVLAAFTGCTGLDPDDSITQDVLQKVRTVNATLVVYGCTPPLNEVFVTATEMTGEQVGPQTQTQSPPPQQVLAQVLPTANVHQFKLVFPALKYLATYSLSATMSTEHCAKVAWKGPHGGRLTVGVTPRVKIEAFAMRTQTEVLATRGPNQQATWVGVDAIDVDAQQGAIRSLRWRTDVPGAVAGRVEISTEPFPVGPAAAHAQIPMLATWTVPIGQQTQDGWHVIPSIDFAALLPSPSCDPQQNPNGCPTHMTLQGALHMQIESGAPIYARVIPIDHAGRPLGDNATLGIASTVKVAHTKLPTGFVPPPPPPSVAPLKFDGIYYFPPQPEYARGYNRGCVTVTKPHNAPAATFAAWSADWYGMMIASAGHFAPGTPIPVGSGWCFNHESGTLDDIVDAISGLVDAVGSMVNEIGKIYDEIKHAVVNAVASAISDLGIVDCDSVCKAGLMAGLDAALAAVGMPPSLPNFDELSDQGFDYLKEVAAEESGVPIELIDEAAEIAGKAINEMKASHSYDGVDWLTPDDGFRPAKLMLQLHKNPAATDPLPGDLRFASGTTFHGTDLLLPTQHMAGGFPEQVTAQFLPDFSRIPPPPPWCPFGPYACVPVTGAELQLYYEDHWYQEMLDESCEGLTATGYGVGHFGDGAMIFLPGPGIQMQWLVTPSAFVSGSDPFKYACP